jgi:hypothetical protein
MHVAEGRTQIWFALQRRPPGGVPHWNALHGSDLITQVRELSSQVAVVTVLLDPRQPLYVQTVGLEHGRHSLPETGGGFGQGKQKLASVLLSWWSPLSEGPSELPESVAASCVGAPEPPAPALPSSAELPISPPEPPDAEAPPLAEVPPVPPPGSPAVPPVAPAPLVPPPESGIGLSRSSASPQPAPSTNSAAQHAAMPRSEALIAVSIAALAGNASPVAMGPRFHWLGWLREAIRSSATPYVRAFWNRHRRSL